ncbi:MAG TPA: response regulator transcription factor [Candidatus Binatia bacterium]|jgi:DNA-binding response OmpR family regulator|nr:response regulator transcription factor [Candidatus Binatia bacterium]
MTADARGRHRVLVVEDDAAEREVVVQVCRQEGYDVEQAATGSEGLQRASAGEHDVVLLDWVLPDITGLDVCRELRRLGLPSSIIMVTGRTAKVDVVVGLEVGADDYITKPFHARELAARLAAHLRRAQRPSEERRRGLVTAGAVEIDTDGRRIRIGGAEVRLTFTEFNLLALLATNQGRVLTRAQLLERVWGYLTEVDYHSVDPHVQRLRKKLEAAGDTGVVVEAVPGLGYRLSARGSNG